MGTDSQDIVLRVLARRPERSLSVREVRYSPEIVALNKSPQWFGSELTGMADGTVRRALDILELRGLVEQTRTERPIEYRVTPEGRDEADRLEKRGRPLNRGWS